MRLLVLAMLLLGCREGGTETESESKFLGRSKKKQQEADFKANKRDHRIRSWIWQEYMGQEELKRLRTSYENKEITQDCYLSSQMFLELAIKYSMIKSGPYNQTDPYNDLAPMQEPPTDSIDEKEMLRLEQSKKQHCPQ